MSKSLNGKVALVTGGSRGIGAAIVRRLSDDGAAVAFTYANSKDKADAVVAEIEAKGGKALAIQANSEDPKAVKDAVASVVAKLGGLDILVNNAGIIMLAPLDKIELADFDKMISVNVRAVFVGAQAAAAHMKQGGRIITIGSVSADRAGFPTSSLYSMTKSAVAALTRGLARDLGPRGITVNTVQPGPTATDMNGQPGASEFLSPLIALGRMAEASEIANLVSFVAGPESSFITGSSLNVDGGYLS